MPNIYLGPSGTETLLPPLRWREGNVPGVPVDAPKQMDEATMLDGSRRYNFRSKHPRRWAFTWDMLTEAEMASFLALRNRNTALHFQNNWEDATWRWVVIAGFAPDPVVVLGGCADKHYRLDLALAEVR